LKEAASIMKIGYEVKVVALHERGLLEKETIAEVETERVKLISRSWPKYPVVQLVKYIEFLIRSFFRYRRTDIFHCSDIYPLPIAVLLRTFNSKAKIIYDANEYETETNGLRGIAKIVKRLLERTLIKKVDAVITVSKSIARIYASDYDIKEPYLVLNTPKYTKCVKENKFREEFNIPDNKTILLYQGSLWQGKGIKDIIRSIAYIKSDICVIFMGHGTMVDYIKGKAVISPGKIYYKPAVSPFEILKYTASADIGLCLLRNTCLSYYYSLPNKLFQYLMAGLPVIISNFPEMERIVKREYNCGLAVDPRSPVEIASKIDELIDNRNLFDELKSNAEAAVKKYNWENQEKVLKKIYREL